MSFKLQKASLWKRLTAFIFDGILLVTLAVGIGTLLSLVLNYDSVSKAMDEAFGAYEKEYDITFNISESDYASFSPEKKERYDTAYTALTQDKEAMALYQRVVNLILLMVSLSLFLAFLLLEFVLPLFLKEGRTLGKKIFGLAVTTTQGIRIQPVQLFARTILGKYAVETMIPVYVITMLLFGNIGMIGTLVLMALLVIQIIIFAAGAHRPLLHDKLAATAVVDYDTQMIFESEEALLQAKKQAAQEEALRREW